MDQPKLDDFEGYRDTAGQSQKNSSPLLNNQLLKADNSNINTLSFCF